ncbi:MAG: hypothetical protein A4E39_00356 [Methanoregulaceae archaeon PtaB.Bin152]|nr:MAG: hypothetical protein A4E39_00356 [Methanoregulaceae archaeon PtaB.Bin152]
MGHEPAFVCRIPVKTPAQLIIYPAAGHGKKCVAGEIDGGGRAMDNPVAEEE